MSTEKLVTINGNEYIFINSFRANRSGFVHESELLKNNWSMGAHKVQYYNRTWERYTYQTVMMGLIHNLLDEIKEEYKNAWKESHGVKRLTEAKRKAMMEDFEGNLSKDYVELVQLYSML